MNLFIVVPNKAGSTLLQRWLATAPNVLSLKNGGVIVEGQAAMHYGDQGSYPSDRKYPSHIWALSKEIYEKNRYKWGSIKKCWEKNWRNNNKKKWKEVKDKVLLEKSPQNIIIAPWLQEKFKDSRFIISVRDPYCVVESIDRNRRCKKHGLNKIARHAIKCLELQIRNREFLENSIYFTYEDLINNPQAILDQLLSFVPALKGLNLSAKMSIHSIDGTGKRGIDASFNKKQRQAFLKRHGKDGLKKVNEVFIPKKEVLDAFGYEIWK